MIDTVDLMMAIVLWVLVPAFAVMSFVEIISMMGR